MEDALMIAALLSMAIAAGWLLHGARWDLREAELLACAEDGLPVLLGGERYLLTRDCSEPLKPLPLGELEEAATQFLQPEVPKRKRFEAWGW